MLKNNSMKIRSDFSKKNSITLAKTVKAGGNVLVPCLPSGLMYDLLEYLLPFMEQQNLINIPIYVVSPSAKASLALSQIYAEW